MAEKITVARPYAKAVFEIAQEHVALPAWSEFLTIAAHSVSDPEFAVLLGNPRVPKERLVALLVEISDESAGPMASNLLQLLAENGRLAYLPEIAFEFERLRAEAESVVEVQVASAVALSEDQRQSIADSMRKRLGKDVRLQCDIDASLLGGAIIRAGDLVIDGSLKGRLERLVIAVTH